MDLIVTVPDDRVNFVKKLLRELNLSVKPAKAIKQAPYALSAAQQQLANELKHSLLQVELHEQGNIKLPSAYDLLNEV